MIRFLALIYFLLISGCSSFIRNRAPASIDKMQRTTLGYEIGIFSSSPFTSNKRITKTYIKVINGPSRIYYGSENDLSKRYADNEIPFYLNQTNNESSGYLYRPGIKTYAENILSHVQQWIVDKYIELGRIEEGGEIYEALLSTESIMDGRSSIVIISDFNDLNNIHALLRVSKRGTTDDTFELPLEKRLMRSFKTEELEKKVINLGDSSKDHILPKSIHSNFDETENKKYYISFGGELELKSFFHTSKDKNFIPHLFDLAETSGIMTSANLIPDRNVISGTDDFHSESRNSYLHQKTAYASKYILECDEMMISYYRRLGFNIDYRDGSDIVMSIDRETFSSRALKRLSSSRSEQQVYDYRPWVRSLKEDFSMVWIPSDIKEDSSRIDSLYYKQKGARIDNSLAKAIDSNSVDGTSRKEFFELADGYFLNKGETYYHNFFSFETQSLKRDLRLSIMHLLEQPEINELEYIKMKKFYHSLISENPEVLDHAFKLNKELVRTVGLKLQNNYSIQDLLSHLSSRSNKKKSCLESLRKLGL